MFHSVRSTMETTAAPAPRLRDLSPQQWKSGFAAWLGWLFDGLDMHLYTLVATPFVAELLRVSSPADPLVGKLTPSPTPFDGRRSHS